MKKLPKVITVHVNKTNIRRGLKGNASSCAVSKAIQREIQAKRHDMSVLTGGGNDIEVRDKNGWTYSYVGMTNRVKERISKFIDNFDNKKSLVKPCKFRIRLCEVSDAE